MLERLSRRRIGSSAAALLCLAVTLGRAGAAWSQTFEISTTASASPGGTQGPALALTDGNRLLSAPVLLDTSGEVNVRGLARNPLTGDVIGIALGAGPTLVHVDFQNAAVTPFGPPLTIGITSLAFDSHGNLFGFALCDETYTNQLFSIDPLSGSLTGALGSLDSATVGPCGSGITMGGVIAIDPATDDLYFTALDASGNLFVDRMSSLLVPTQVAFNPVFVVPAIPVAATFAGGKMWIATNLTQLGPATGFFIVDPASGVVDGANGAGFWAVGNSETAPVYGLLAATPACVPSANVACLFDRFKVAVNYDATPNSGKGPATVLLESNQSVKFSFFDPTNVELILKILNACTPPFNNWWVSAGGLTNVGVTITVTDTKTGKSRNYSNTKDQLFQPFFDTAAFACP